MNRPALTRQNTPKLVLFVTHPECQRSRGPSDAVDSDQVDPVVWQMISAGVVPMTTESASKSVWSLPLTLTPTRRPDSGGGSSMRAAALDPMSNRNVCASTVRAEELKAPWRAGISRT